MGRPAIGWRKADAWAAVLTALISLATCASAGRVVTLSSTPDQTYYRLNDRGVAVTGQSALMFQVKTCQDALIRLSSTYDLGSPPFLEVVIGAGSNSWSGIRQDCGTCYPAVVYNGPVLNCSAFTPLWLHWGERSCSVGRGSEIGIDSLVSLNSASNLEVNYIAVASYLHQSADWRIIIDEAPVWVMPETSGVVVNVPEGVDGWPLLSLVAQDPENDTLEFRVDHPDFNLNGTQLQTTTALDFEATPAFSVSLSVSDGRSNVTTHVLVLVDDVNDERPEIQVRQSTSIFEELPLETSIGWLFSSSDKDLFDSVAFTISGLNADYFSIDPATGELFIEKRIDYDGPAGVKQLTFTLAAVDMAGNTASSDVNITVVNVNDIPLTFDLPFYTAWVYENTSSDQSLLNFTVYGVSDDVDNEVIVSAEVISLLCPQNAFHVSNESLMVTAGLLDYELLNESNFTCYILLTATESGNESFHRNTSAAVVVTILPVNEYAPVWEANLANDVTLSEDTVPGSKVMRVNASDLDLGLDGELLYSIVSVTSGNGSYADTMFFLHPTSGELTTTLPLDYDEHPRGLEYYDVTIMATDHGTPSLSTPASLRVNLVDVNDNAPEFKVMMTSVTLHCSMNTGDVILELHVEDVEDGYDVILELRNSTLLELQPNTRFVVLRSLGTRDMSVMETAVVIATDRGTPSRSSEAYVIAFLPACSDAEVDTANISALNSTEVAPADTVDDSRIDDTTQSATSGKLSTTYLTFEIWLWRAVSIALALALLITVSILIALNRKQCCGDPGKRPKTRKLAPLPQAWSVSNSTSPESFTRSAASSMSLARTELTPLPSQHSLRFI